MIQNNSEELLFLLFGTHFLRFSDDFELILYILNRHDTRNDFQCLSKSLRSKFIKNFLIFISIFEHKLMVLQSKITNATIYSVTYSFVIGDGKLLKTPQQLYKRKKITWTNKYKSTVNECMCNVHITSNKNGWCTIYLRSYPKIILCYTNNWKPISTFNFD